MQDVSKSVRIFWKLLGKLRSVSLNEASALANWCVGYWLKGDDIDAEIKEIDDFLWQLYYLETYVRSSNAELYAVLLNSLMTFYRGKPA